MAFRWEVYADGIPIVEPTGNTISQIYFILEQHSVVPK
jgi:hypothetical protein